MLDKLRQQSRSFIVTFGPASMRLSCGGSTRAGTVAGHEISNADLQFALRLAMVSNAPATHRLTVYDWLLRRELLAMEAERMGFQVQEDDIVQMITKRRRIMVLGQVLDLARTGAWPTVRNKENKRVPAPNYYHDRFKRWVNHYLGMKMKEFMEQQRKELLAKRAEQTIKNGVMVTDREARAIYEYQNHSLKLQFARFSVDDFKKGVLVKRSELMTWLSQKENRDAVDKLYKKVKWKLTGLPLERRVRQLLVKVDPKASAADKAKAKAKAEAFRQAVLKTPTDFAVMAQRLSEDEATKDSGGDLGWVEKSKLSYGKAFADAVFKLKPMTVSPVLTSDKGYHVVLVEGERKGDVPLGQARTWLAEQMIIKTKAMHEAKVVAKEALRRLNMGQTMEQVFPADTQDSADGDEDKKPTESKPSDKATDKPDKSDKPAKPKRWHPYLPTPQEVTVLRTDSTIGQIGKIKGLVDKVWKLTEKDPVLDEVVTLPGTGTSLGSLVLIRLKSKTVPNDEDFKSQKSQIEEELLEVKQDDAVKRWVYQRCVALRADNQIKFDDRVSKVTFMQGKGENQKKTVVKYVPCQRLERFSRASAGQRYR